jgi:probable HAF family extracellular repeat protein
MTTCKAILSFVVLLLVSVPLTLAQGTYTQLDYPGASSTDCVGINTAGDVVGYYADSSGNYHGFLLSGGTYTTIDYPGSSVGTFLYGINDSRRIVGWGSVGFSYDVQTATFAVINASHAVATEPLAINNSGTIAGYLNLENGVSSIGFRLVGQTYQSIVAKGASTTEVSGISSSGAVVGSAYIPQRSTYYNFEYFDGQFHSLQISALINQGETVSGINPAGSEIVGSYFDPSSNLPAGFTYQEKVLQTLVFPDSVETFATGVNASGVVVGWFDFYSSQGVRHGYMWIPPADGAKK